MDRWMAGWLREQQLRLSSYPFNGQKIDALSASIKNANFLFIDSRILLLVSVYLLHRLLWSLDFPAKDIRVGGVTTESHAVITSSG